MKMREGMRVRVAKVPTNEPAYEGLVGEYGVTTGDSWTDLDDEWVYVKLDRDRVACEFKTDELIPVNMRSFEGVANIGYDRSVGQHHIGLTQDDPTLSLWAQLLPDNGKRVRLTWEVLDEEVPHATD